MSVFHVVIKDGVITAMVPEDQAAAAVEKFLAGADGMYKVKSLKELYQRFTEQPITTEEQKGVDRLIEAAEKAVAEGAKTGKNLVEGLVSWLNRSSDKLWLKNLPKDTANDLKELLRQLAEEDDASLQLEITETIREILFPDCLNVNKSSKPDPDEETENQ